MRKSVDLVFLLRCWLYLGGLRYLVQYCGVALSNQVKRKTFTLSVEVIRILTGKNWINPNARWKMKDEGEIFFLNANTVQRIFSNTMIHILRATDAEEHSSSDQIALRNAKKNKSHLEKSQGRHETHCQKKNVRNPFGNGKFFLVHVFLGIIFHFKCGWSWIFNEKRFSWKYLHKFIIRNRLDGVIILKKKTMLC